MMPTRKLEKGVVFKSRNGQVRILIGSTQKMGAGTNVQDKLIAVHHLDVGWRPADMTQETEECTTGKQQSSRTNL